MKIFDFLIQQNKLNRSWTETETKNYGIMNDEELKKLNLTLRPSKGIKTGKVGCFLFGQSGDLMEAMGVLKYIDVLFPNKEIVWFANFPNADALRYSNVSEVRRWPWAGYHLPDGCPDYDKILCNSENKLDLEKAKDFPDTADLEDGYFPAPHMVAAEKREGVEYSNVSKQVFGVPMDWEWHPYLSWDDKEREDIHNFINTLPSSRKIILFETFGGSGQSSIDDDMIKRTIQACREKLGMCNIIFVSHKYLRQNESYPEGFFNNEGIFSASQFTPRQCALLNKKADLMICISSGISVSTSCWGNKPVPKLQFCGSRICSTGAIANGEFHLVECNADSMDVVKSRFFEKLNELLSKI